MHPALRHTYYYSSLLEESDVNIVFLKIGQSNETGGCGTDRMEANTAYVERPDGVKRFVKGAGYFSTADDGGWVDYFSGKIHNQAASLGKLINDRMHRNVYMIEAALGGSAMASKVSTFNDWNELNTSDCYEQALVHHFTPAIAKLPTDRDYKVVICWQQGEADGTSVTDYNAYAANFTNMMAALRAYHAKLAEAPILITKLHYNVNAGETVINTFFDTYASDPDNNAYVLDVAPEVTYPRNADLTPAEKAAFPPVGYSDDNHNSHYFQIKKGEMQYQKLLEINFIPSLSAESGYHRDLKDMLLRATELAYTHPSTNNKDAIHTLINSLDVVVTGNKTVYKKIMGLWLPANDGSSQFGLLNVKSTTLFTGSLVNAPTWTSKQGWAFNGTTQYFNSNCLVGTTYQPFNSTWYQNISAGQLVHAIATKIGFGISRVGSSADFYLQGVFAGATGRCFNATAVSPLTNLSSATKFIAMTRGVSTDWDYYMGATKTNVVHTRTGSSTGAVKFGFDGGGYGDETLSVPFVAEYLTEAELTVLRNALTAYKAAL